MFKEAESDRIALYLLHSCYLINVKNSISPGRSKEDPQTPGLQFAVPAVLPMSQKEVGTDALIFW